MPNVQSIHVAGCIASIVALIGIVAVRADEAEQKRIESSQSPTAPDSLTAPKRVRTVPIRPPPAEPKSVESTRSAAAPKSLAWPEYMRTAPAQTDQAKPDRIESSQSPTVPNEPKRVPTTVIRVDPVWSKRTEPSVGRAAVEPPGVAAPPVSSPAPVVAAQHERGAPAAQSFNFARYQAVDLGAVMERRRPATGIDIHPALPLKFAVALASYAEPCNAELLKRTMVAAAIPKDLVDAAPVTRCVKVRTAKGGILPLFIQDPVAEFLPKEVPLGSAVTLFAIHLFTGPDGPGLLVNEFLAGICGPPDFNPGVEYSAAEGAPIPAADDGIVVKAEENELALVDTPSAGHCGRYIVIKHSYPNGRSVFTRYAELGRLVGADGRPIAAGMHVMKNAKIGEIGSRNSFHFEVRPVEPATMDASAGWTQHYGADPTMEWSRFQSVDPQAFHFDVFGGTGTTAK